MYTAIKLWEQQINIYMTENTCRLNYGTLKAINYKKIHSQKILEKLFRVKGKGDSNIPI